MKLSVIIPVYNEVNTISEIINRVRVVNVGMEKEIIVVDGNSSDGTKDKLKAEIQPDIKIIYESRREGKGAAVRQGIAAASGDIIVIQDADLEVSPEEYPHLLKHIVANESEVVFGSRFLGKSKFRFISLLANKMIIGLTNFFFGSNLSDVLTCYKVFKSDILKGITFECKGFDFDTELAVKLVKKGIKIKEVPINYSPRTYGEGKKINWKDGFRSVYVILKNKLVKSIDE